MNKKSLRSWKKVYKSDLSYIVYELKGLAPAPALIILEGDLGAGKTTFTKCFIDEETMSPSYSVISETTTVLHADFYRIKNREEIIHLELPLYLEDKQYFLAEWGLEHFESICRELPEDFSTYLMKIDVNKKTTSDTTDEGSRNFELFEVNIH